MITVAFEEDYTADPASERATVTSTTERATVTSAKPCAIGDTIGITADPSSSID